MQSEMWSLEDFRFDDAIPGLEVVAPEGPNGTLQVMPKDQAIQLAHSRGAALIAEWPGGEQPVPCRIGKLALPLRWERVPGSETTFQVDEELWFEGSCGGRDFLVGNGHTFHGRLQAWCPQRRVTYNVSSSEVRDSSVAARYYVEGFLAGSEPGPPLTAMTEGEQSDDLDAWHAATARFRRTGLWNGRWGTCAQCGCVLLPDSAADRCAEHLTSES